MPFKFKTVICVNAPVNGSIEAVVCTSDLGRHPLMSSHKLLNLARRASSVDVFPDKVNIYDSVAVGKINTR
ncbi:hypothetical protein M8J75_001790 [Diaphorina citri]|nr:hypothetical protein M8J75_001790 [Diaphorina citri]KAI5708251.1 hypothetical protein M8J77_019110 [Diaphorina citri]